MKVKIYSSIEELLQEIRKPVRESSINWYFGPYVRSAHVDTPFGQLIVSVDRKSIGLLEAANFRNCWSFPTEAEKDV